jgi:hypothetical protein
LSIDELIDLSDVLMKEGEPGCLAVSKEEEIAKNVEATHCLALVLHISRFSSSNNLQILGSWSFLALENHGA